MKFHYICGWLLTAKISFVKWSLLHWACVQAMWLCGHVQHSWKFNPQITLQWLHPGIFLTMKISVAQYSSSYTTQEVLSLVNEYAHFKNAYFISNCGESPMTLTQWECSWIAKYFLQVYSLEIDISLLPQILYCEFWQHNYNFTWLIRHASCARIDMSLFITSDILNTIGTGNSGASKLVKIVFEGNKNPLKKQTRRKVRVTVCSSCRLDIVGGRYTLCNLNWPRVIIAWHWLYCLRLLTPGCQNVCSALCQCFGRWLPITSESCRLICEEGRVGTYIMCM